ncbi:alpha/beta hydrolase family protein [Pseudonocardia nantongensis]|uniref:alpha/beta hydrolase family protein n=1 Tax=Pseudonocardia nantongensis TaxID=1181885 RepID=UPI00397E75E5
MLWFSRAPHTDPARVAIYGSSYGGYAALVGAAFTPADSPQRSATPACPTSSTSVDESSPSPGARS